MADHSKRKANGEVAGGAKKAKAPRKKTVKAGEDEDANADGEGEETVKAESKEDDI